jgi:glucose/arabinose dehydrogenase
MKRTAWLIACCLALACDDDSSGPGGGSAQGGECVSGPDLHAPPTSARGGREQPPVRHRATRSIVFENRSYVLSSVFLDITDRVLYQNFSEMGLLGLAFHPDYENNGFFFVYYVTDSPRRDRLSRFQVTADANVADPASEKILLEFEDDYPNHNGGGICFGPDGYLYVGIGDEGGAGDPDNNAQDLSRPFGKILRIDVDQNVDTTPYHGIPADNPYAGNASGYREDIWAHGFRNPWRISFDAVEGDLFAGDVGQRTWEEIDIIERGGNFGWDCLEGGQDYNEAENPSSPLCTGATNIFAPVLVYGRSDGASITGGYVYHGSRLPELQRRYIYGDFSSGKIWALSSPGSSTLLIDTALYISTFGVAQDGELLVAAYFADGAPSALYRLSPI